MHPYTSSVRTELGDRASWLCRLWQLWPLDCLQGSRPTKLGSLHALDILMQNTVLLLKLLSTSVCADFSMKNLSPIFVPLYLIYLVSSHHSPSLFSILPCFFVCLFFCAHRCKYVYVYSRICKCHTPGFQPVSCCILCTV